MTFGVKLFYNLPLSRLGLQRTPEPPGLKTLSNSGRDEFTLIIKPLP